MRGTIIVYDLNTKKLGKTQIIRFHRKLYGYTDYSKFGKYRYAREGLLDRIPNFTPSRSTIVTEQKYARKIIDLIKNFTPNVFVRKILLTRDDVRKLRKSAHSNF